jgi:hypothetical protein
LPGVPPQKQDEPLQWKSADLLEAAIPITGRETVLSTVEIPGEPPVTLAPVCLPYSPEFAPDQPGRGAATLAQLATTSGGQERIEIPGTWADLPSKPRFIELAPWLLVASVILFLLEIFERRTGWVSRWFAPKPAVAAVPVEDSVETPAPRKYFFEWLRPRPSPKVHLRKREIKEPAPAPASPKAGGAGEPPAGGSPDANLEALRKARERANRRTDRKP